MSETIREEDRALHDTDVQATDVPRFHSPQEVRAKAAAAFRTACNLPNVPQEIFNAGNPGLQESAAA